MIKIQTPFLTTPTVAVTVPPLLLTSCIRISRDELYQARYDVIARARERMSIGNTCISDLMEDF